MKTIRSIKPSRETDVNKIIDVLSMAFLQDPVARWLYPDLHHYLADFPNFIRAFGGTAFEENTAWATRDFSGASLWYSPDAHADDAPLTTILEQTVGAEILESALNVFQQMDRHHPEEPHWYLAMTGVDPACQGKGRGSDLLKHMLHACDRDRKPAYLESSNPENLSLYRRHGFEVMGTIQSGDSPPLFPMVRQPR